jgi:hypothetical protein
MLLKGEEPSFTLLTDFYSYFFTLSRVYAYYCLGFSSVFSTTEEVLAFSYFASLIIASASVILTAFSIIG